ncbi:MAG TPA: hypothetical protein VIM34_03000 [Burkholderiaceae bacterium]
MPTLQTRMHPGVMPADAKMRARYQRGPHLMAGSLDGACGIYALWSALIVLGVATRSDVLALPSSSNTVLAEVWARGVETFFSGTDSDEIQALLHGLERYISYRACDGAMRTQIEFVTDSLRRGEVVIVGLERPRGRGDGHWVLAVGMEELVSKTTSEVIGILCLDSGEPAPQLLRFNARLELQVPHHGATYVRYLNKSGDAHTMTIDTAIALRRRPSIRAPRKIGGDR